jgi:hypothetical protein
MPDLIRPHELAQPEVELRMQELVLAPRGTRHEQLAVDDLVAIPVVGEQVEVVRRPAGCFGDHEHTVNSLGRGTQC